MRAFVLLLSLTLSQIVFANPCETMLSGRIDIDLEVDRIAMTRLLREPEILVQGHLALNPENPVRVITLNSSAYLLAVDVREMNRVGVREFMKQHAVLSEEPRALTNMEEAWVSRIEERFAIYSAENSAGPDLSTLWSDSQTLKVLDEVLFLRYDDRMALISLRAPGYSVPSVNESIATASQEPEKKAPLFVPLAKIQPRAASRANNKSFQKESNPRIAPETTLFQIRVTDKDKPTYVTWDAVGVKIAGAKKWLDKILNSDTPEIIFHPQPNVMMAVYRFPEAPQLLVLRRSENEYYKRVSVVSSQPIRVAEVAQLQVEANRSKLEDADEIEFSIQGKAPTRSGIYLPSAVVDTSLYTRASYALFLRVLSLTVPEQLAALQDLAPGEVKFMTSPHFLATDSVEHYARLFAFMKGEDSKIYLLSMLEQEPDPTLSRVAYRRVRGPLYGLEK